jgi:hypothetical protein
MYSFVQSALLFSSVVVACTTRRSSLNRAWLQLTRPEKSLAGLKDHAIVYFKKLIDEQPSAIGRVLVAVTIFENPIPVDIFNGALESTELVILELDIARWHAADQDFLIAFESEDLV